MEIIKLTGKDPQLYKLVAHLVMDEEVLKYNLNFPYKTSAKHGWFIAIDDSRILGFIPVKLINEKATINNYYVRGNDPSVFSALLNEVVKRLQDTFEIESIVQLAHVPYFEQCGFSVLFNWKRYVKMKILEENEKKCL